MKRWFGIRHVRWLWLAWKLEQHCQRCARLGLGFFPQESDLDYLDKVWKGQA